MREPEKLTADRSLGFTRKEIQQAEGPDVFVQVKTYRRHF